MWKSEQRPIFKSKGRRYDWRGKLTCADGGKSQGVDSVKECQESIPENAPTTHSQNGNQINYIQPEKDSPIQ